MSTVTNVGDGVREVSENDSLLLEAKGRAKNLSRDNLIVHVGKPVGSISGWVGTSFWQVWSDRYDEAGVVHARIDEDSAETWEMDPSLTKAELLDRAKDRLIAQVRKNRAASLDQAIKEEAALSAA